MNDWRLWALLVLSVGGIAYNVVTHYAIRGNELKHLKEAIAKMEAALIKRIERLENRLLNNK